MNAKQSKRIRRNIRLAMVASGASQPAEKPPSGVQIERRQDTTHIRGLVDSKRYDSTVIGANGVGELQEGKAVQNRVTPESFRGIYLRVKTNVQANRSKKRSRVLPGIQLRPKEATGAVEHTGTASVQRQHSNVHVL